LHIGSNFGLAEYTKLRYQRGGAFGEGFLS
jgi:hypothetical protein